MKCGYVIKIKDLRKHENADRLQIAKIFGNDVVVGLDVKIGDEGVYFPTDLKLSKNFANHLGLTKSKGGYLEDNKLHIKAVRLRGEMSDGLYISREQFNKYVNIDDFKVGSMISTVGGELICEKYIPFKNINKPMPTSKKVIKESPFPFFQKHIDTEQMAYNMHKLKEDMLLTISLKLHGTSQRTSYSIKNNQQTWIQKILKLKPKKTWEYVTGTRNVTLLDIDKHDGGFYKDNTFRKEHHDFFVGKLRKGETVYYEVVGYDGEKPIMPKADNKLINDKEFVKKYGATTTFSYGCKPFQSDIYVYRMTMTNEDGDIVEYPTSLLQLRCDEMDVKIVPVLDQFYYTTEEDFLKRLEYHTNGSDLIDATHIREGVVIRVENSPTIKLFKNKSFDFKVLEGIIKDSGVTDIEEMDSVL